MKDCLLEIIPKVEMSGRQQSLRNPFQIIRRSANAECFFYNGWKILYLKPDHPDIPNSSWILMIAWRLLCRDSRSWLEGVCPWETCL